MLGLVSIAAGETGKGLRIIEETLWASDEKYKRGWYATTEQILGQLYLQIANKSAKVSLTSMAKNVGFIVKNLPSADKKAEEHFDKAIEAAKEIGAKGALDWLI